MQLVWRPIVAVQTILLFSALALSAASQQPEPGSANSGKFDGPAELPRVYVKSSLADTPAPGRVRLVREGENLQEAIEGAKCGDTLKLQAGATFQGTFKLPSKPCDDSHWIVIRTSAADDALPPEGTRLTPCFGGIAALPGRPQFQCSHPTNALAKLVFDARGNSGPITFLAGANHYRFTGLEITRAAADQHMRNLVETANDATAHHIIFDRVWLHGGPQDETKAGIHLSGMSYVAVVDSYLNDFKCIAREGSCTDAQAINGGSGNDPGGPYKIENNFLEASGECILFGGAPATTTPADIEIRRNHLFKPMSWKPGQQEFVGTATGAAFIVKNHFELKNAQRVLFEGNVLDNVWGGFSQHGFSILLTPKNQAPNVCPLCRVTDITVRYNKVRHVGGVLQIANVPSGTHGSATAGERYSIHDLVASDIDGDAYKGFGSFALIMSETPLLKDVAIDHVTAFPPNVLISISSSVEQPKIQNFKVTNSIFGAGDRQIGSAGGGRKNCAFQPDMQGPEGVLKSCFDNWEFTHNLIVGGGGHWPKGNAAVRNEGDAGIKSADSNYRLCREKEAECKKASPAIHAAADGKDLGVDVEALEKLTAGVE